MNIRNNSIVLQALFCFEKKKYIANFAVQQGTNDQSYQTLGIKSYRKWFLAHKECGSVEMA
jgi:hypothetical protein